MQRYMRLTNYMDKWTEVKTAYRLAKLGTLSAVAEDLGIHRSTVMRHIDALEAHLGLTLFQRNDKGYIATDMGLEIMRLGQITDEQLSRFVNKARNKEEVIEGKLKLTCVAELSLMLFPAINKYQTLYPNVNVEIVGDIRNFDLEYGEADVAIRAGNKPETLDNVVMPYAQSELVLCVHQNYVDRFGMPSKDNYMEHKFIANNDRVAHLYWNEWVHEHIPESNIAITSGSQQVLTNGLYAGAGISWSTKETVETDPKLHQVDVGISWQVNTWILVHRDIFNIPKVRKFIDVLNAEKSVTIKLPR